MLVFRVDRVLAVFLEPLRNTRRAVQLLHDVAPTHAGVVGAEGYLPLLGAIRNDAHLGAPKVVVEEILKPHPGHEQEAPRELLGVPFGFADGLAPRAGLAHQLAEQLTHAVSRRAAFGLEVPEERHGHFGGRQRFGMLRVGYALQVL